MDWTLEAIDRLRKMWAEGLSTAEIGRRMGVSRHAITGKAHRLNLSTRPSPIRRDPAEPRHLTMGRRTTLPKIETAAVAGVVTDEPPPPAAGALPGKQPATTTQRVTKCCWPIGEPRTPDFRFCEAEPAPDKPYCAKHAGIAYVKPRGDASKNDVA
jgi:GcrA cell cycle regulator